METTIISKTIMPKLSRKKNHHEPKNIGITANPSKLYGNTLYTLMSVSLDYTYRNTFVIIYD